MDYVVSTPVSVPFWVAIWPIVNLVIFVLLVIGGVIFIRFIMRKLKKIDKMEQTTEEILSILRSKH